MCYFRSKFDFESNVEKVVLDLIEENERITTTEISEIIRKSRKTVQKIINSLKDNGHIERIGSNKNGVWKAIK